MRRFVLFSVVLSFGLLSVSFAQNTVPTYRLRTRSFAEIIAKQRQLVGDYCRADFEGGRLTPNGWNGMGPLTTMRTNPDFNYIVIVSRYQMDAPARPTDNVDVSYLVIGRYENGIGFSRSSRSDVVTFRVVDKDDDLVISDIGSPAPHVSLRAALAWMKERLAHAKSELEKDQLRDALKNLQPAAPPAQ